MVFMKPLIEGCDNMTMLWVETKSNDQGRHENDAFFYSFCHTARLPRKYIPPHSLLTTKQNKKNNTFLAFLRLPFAMEWTKKRF